MRSNFFLTLVSMPFLTAFAASENVKASFPCTGQLTRTEQVICSKPNLKDKDRTMHDLYERALIVKAEVRSTQREWLQRRNKLSDEYQLARIYDRRIAYLNAVANRANELLPSREPVRFENANGTGKTYQIPNDCGAFMGESVQYQRDQIQINEVTKTENICKFFTVAGLGAQEAKSNLFGSDELWYFRLQDMPYLDCDLGTGESGWSIRCEEFAKARKQMNQLSAAVHYDEAKNGWQISDQSSGKKIDSTCHMNELIFMGTIDHKAQKVTCRNQSDAPNYGFDSEESGFAIDYFALRDVNKDGFMDLVLYVSSHSPGSLATGTVIVLERKTPGVTRRLFF